MPPGIAVVCASPDDQIHRFSYVLPSIKHCTNPPALDTLTAPDTPSLPVGLIGFGYAGRTFHAPLLQATPGLHIAAVASRQADAVQSALGSGVAVHASPEELIARPDLRLVVIATPNDSHHPLAMAALRAGKAVVVDKPMALDAVQAAGLVREAAQHGQLLSVFHNRRWDGDFLAVQALLASGRLGRVTQARLHFDRYRPLVRARWREADGAGGGLWIDLGPHLVDQALQLFGEPVAIQADLAAQRDGAGGDDWFSATLRFADGLRITLSASTLAASPAPRFALHGTLGSYLRHGLDRQEDVLKTGLRPGLAGWEEAIAEPAGELVTAADPARHDELQHSDWPTPPGRYTHYYAAMRDALLGLGPNPVAPAESLAVMQWLDRGRESARLRREVTP
jgi:predicted dehydrogenase